MMHSDAQCLGDIVGIILHEWVVIGERERANLVVQLARFFCIYIYIYPALMYAVMFYVILNKRKRLGDCVTFLVSGTLEGDTMQRLNALTWIHRDSRIYLGLPCSRVIPLYCMQLEAFSVVC